DSWKYYQEFEKMCKDK
ncbi:DUF2972 domain-containing protein, partial [Campylobacter jejuni]|nr:DUF2972 domain-containing protein [Campylobacter jejuni]